MIYLDVLLLVNFLTAYFLLLGAGVLSGQRANFPRMLLGSGIAALSALILFAPEQPYCIQLAYKLITALIIVAATFGWRNRLRLLTATFWYGAMNIALAGVALFAIRQGEAPLLQTGNMVFYLRISPLLLIGLSGVCCLSVEMAVHFLERRKPTTQTVGLEVELGGAPVHLRAALDTGCHLVDPITCLPVLVVSFPDAQNRLPRDVRAYLQAWFAGNPPAEPPPNTKLRLIPGTTASQQSLMPGFAVQNIGLITSNGVLGLGRSAVAFAPQSFGSDLYEALYGTDFL